MLVKKLLRKLESLRQTSNLPKELKRLLLKSSLELKSEESGWRSIERKCLNLEKNKEKPNSKSKKQSVNVEKNFRNLAHILKLDHMLVMLMVYVSLRSSDLFMILINKDVCHVFREKLFHVDLNFTMTWMEMVTMIPLVCQQARTITPDGSTLITECQNHLEF
jgi:hypothetical protein